MRKLEPIESTEGNFKIIYTVLNRLLRKPAKKIVYAIPPLPVSFYAAAMTEDTTLNHLCPLKSTGNTFIFRCLAEAKVKEVVFDFNILRDNQRITYVFNVKSGRTLIDPREIEFFVGDRISICLIEPSNVTDVWIGFLLNIDKAAYNYNKILIDELDKTMDEELKEIESK